jgi:nicotinamide mononucleotide (NMN) deamidase PncC
MFQNVLDQATIQLDSELNTRVLEMLSTYQLRISIAETISIGSVAQRFAIMDADNHYIHAGFICPNTVSLIEYCQVPAALLSDLGTSDLAKAMVQGLHKKSKSTICIATSGTLTRDSHTAVLSAEIHFGIYIQGVTKVKTMTITGGEQTFYARIGQAALKSLEGFLMQHFENKGDL